MKQYKNKTFSGDEVRFQITQDFVNVNKFSINIDAVKKIIEGKFHIFSFDKEVAVDFLPYNIAKQYYNTNFVKSIESGEEKEPKAITDVCEAAQDFLDYMVFAWKKAMDERGISASRSIIKLAAWMKILNRPDVAEVLEDEKLYNPYGRPALVKACKMLGISYPKYLE